jgi:PAS domain S-box-containing protein
MLLDAVLRRRGYDTVSCSDAESAWSLCRQDPFELVVLDWMLPGMDGLELCRKIRSLAWGDRAIILAVTSRTAAEDLQEILVAGADDYLSKPIDPALLDVRLAIAEHSLEVLIERKRAEEALLEAQHELELRVDERTAELAAANQELMAEISERQRIQEALEQSEQDYRTIFNNAHDAIIIYSAKDETVLDINQSGCEIFGYSRDVIVGKPLSDISGSLVTGGTDLGVEVTHFRKDGAPIAIEANATAIQYKGQPAILSISRDVTERRVLEQRLRQAQKMEALGQLAGTIAHDFNNIITAILGTTELLKRRLGDGHAMLDDIALINRASQSAANLTRSLLAFARQRMLLPMHFDLNDLVTELMPVLQRLLPDNVLLRHVPGNQLGLVKADRGQMEQVIMNLVSNARDALVKGGSIVIETGNQTIGDSYLADHPWAYTGDFVYVSVTDDGLGMDEETQGKIFDIYFTTKAPGKGSGLGLASVYGSIKQHQGLIEVHSEPGQGSSFKVLLPEAEEAAEEFAAVSEEPAGGGNETLLVVEDYDDLREVVIDFVESLGYQALPAVDGNQAFEILQSRRDDLHLVVTDITMPGLSGLELYQRSRELAPHLGFVFCTGNARESGDFLERTDEKIFCLEKPFSMESLARKIREALDERPAH